MKRIASILSEAMPPDQALAMAERIWALTDEPILTEDELNRTMATLAEASRRIAATLLMTAPLLTMGDPRRPALTEAAIGLRQVASALELGVEQATGAA